MDAVSDGFRHAFRRLARRPGLTTVTVLILALGIGISTAVFSVARRVLLRPLPVPDLSALTVAWEEDPSQAASLIEVSLPYFLDWRAESHSFEDLAAFGSVNWSYEFRSPRETVASAAVSDSFFDTLGAHPLLGRTLEPGDDDPQNDRALVLSYGVWQRRFAGDPAVVGRKVTGGDRPFTIVGVMPKEFDFPRGAQVWTSVAGELESARRSMAPAAFRSLGVLYVVGRLKSGVSLEAAQAELGAITRRHSLADGFSSQGWNARAVPLVDHYLGASTRRALEALLVASGLLLLLACANVAVLRLVQAIRMASELAVRHAIGASRGRLALHHLAESVLVALAGGIAGTLLATWAVQLVAAHGPSEIAGLENVRVDGGGLAFALLATAACSILVAMAPAWLASRAAIASILKAGRGGPDRRGVGLTRLFVAAEVALAIVLVVGAGLLVRSLGKLLEVPLGFTPERTLSVSVGLASEKYPTVVERRALYRTLLERLAVQAGVEAAGAVSLPPLTLGPIGMDNWVTVEGQPLDQASVVTNSVSVNWEVASPDYFRAVGTRLVAGRTFTEHDSADAPKVVVVSQSLAERCWPGRSPLGQRLHTYGAQSKLENGVFVDVEWQTVVGVVEDARYRGVQNPRPDVYLAYGQAPESVGYLIVRTSGDPLTAAGPVREIVRTLDPEAEVGGITPMTDLVKRALAPWRFASGLLAGFALAALLLTASGLFAVLHHFVAGRTREIAIRMAVGATPGRVRALVLSQGLQVTAAGLIAGVLLSAASARALSALLYGVGERDPWSYVGGAALIGAVATFACLLPAGRAARVAPSEALRSD